MTGSSMIPTSAGLEAGAVEAAFTDEQIGEWCAEAQGKVFGVIPQARYVIERALASAPVPEAGKAVDSITRTDILREWFGGKRYARDYEYLDANFRAQADRVVAYLSALASSPSPTGAAEPASRTALEQDHG